MEKQRKQLITIHGINSKGKWQSDLTEVLGPHFKCSAIKYSDYRWLGATKILIDPLALLLCISVSIYFYSYSGGGRVSLATFIIASFVIAMLVSTLRRIRTLRKVKKALDDLTSTGKSPHVIAHSFGTYLLGCIIAHWSDIRIDHVIFIGCVLKRKTPWSSYLKKNPKAVRRIRNEMATGDLTAWLAVIFYGLFPGLGHAGVVGFSDLSHYVDPNSGCGVECTMLVHNVRLGRLGHRDVFEGRGHAQRFWLPFLWGLDPTDFEEFIEMCLLAEQCDLEGDHYRLGIIEDELRNRRWRWTNYFTLNDYLKDQIEYLLKHRDVQPLRRRVRLMRDVAVRELWHIIALAHEAQEVGSEAGDTTLQRYLHPKVAAIYAVNAAQG